MNRYEMEPILNPIGRFVIYGDHLNAIEELEARVAELEARIFTLHGYSKIALDVLQNRPWPTPNYEAYRPLEGALSEILAMTQPKR